MKPTERSLATVLFTDIVGSTERAAELGDRGWHELLDEFHARVRAEIRRFDGVHVSTAGDGSLATFERPARAIRCAWAIREAVRELGLEIRSGVHSGEIEHHGRDVGGIAVHIGARVASQAGPGEVLVTSTVRELVTGAGFRFEDRGKRALKGVPQEWGLFALRGLPAGLPSRTGRWIPEVTGRQMAMGIGVVLAILIVLVSIRMARDSGGLVGEAEVTGAAPAITVLPFSVHGRDLDVWREGMVDLLSTGLDGAAGLRAIDSRTVLAQWEEEIGADIEADLPRSLRVAQQTGARYALLGSAVAVGRQVRLVADIYEIRNRRSLGQVQVEGSPDSVLALVDRLAVQVLGVVLEKEPGELPRIDLASLTTGSPLALKAYLEGEVRYRRSDFEGAIKAWERAVAADSTFALAYYRLSEAYGWEGLTTRAGSEFSDRAYRLVGRLPEREAVLVRAQRAFNAGTLDGVELLEEAVRKHPDDAEAWYMLGDSYYHHPGTLKGPEEVERVFERAAELEPGSAPYRAHLLDLAFEWHAESARVSRQLEAYARLAPQGLRTRAGRVAFALAFGVPDERASARAALDTVDPEVGRYVYLFLRHPRFAAERDTVFLAIDPRLDDQIRRNARWSRFYDTSQGRGQVRKALGYLDDPLTPMDLRVCGPIDLAVRGLPVPSEALESILAFGPSDVTSGESPWWLVCVAQYAAHRGRWDRYREIDSFARREAQRALADGDSVEAREIQNALLELDAYAAWRRRRREEALRGFKDILAKSGGGDTPSPSVWYVAQLSFELGRLEEAERAFRRQWRNPLAYLYLGRIYEQLGERRKAQEAYEFFVTYWRDADPELQPMVEEARQAAIRLRGLRRE